MVSFLKLIVSFIVFCFLFGCKRESQKLSDTNLYGFWIPKKINWEEYTVEKGCKNYTGYFAIYYLDSCCFMKIQTSVSKGFDDSLTLGVDMSCIEINLVNRKNNTIIFQNKKEKIRIEHLKIQRKLLINKDVYIGTKMITFQSLDELDCICYQ